MARITESDFTAAYCAAKEWVAGTASEKNAVDSLVETRGLNRASASDLVRNFRQMIRGEAFHRTMSLGATDFYLLNIRRDFGEAEYSNAIRSFEQHLDYYEALANGGLRPAHRALLDAHKALQVLPDATALNETLEKETAAAARLSSDERQRRLSKAPKFPQKQVATVTVFRRNALVIAEVLARARGRCEQCGLDAPFLKKRDGTPYLEVHHRVRLADDGEDTVENALAVCPNCHRREHFG